MRNGVVRMTNIPNRWRRLLAGLWAAALLLPAAGCSGADGEDPAGPATVNLDLHIALADDAAGADAYEAAENDGEKMHTLRVVVVRPDGAIEHNRFFDLAEGYFNEPQLEFGTPLLKVAGGERKRIYLFVNERTTYTDSDGTTKRVIDYDLSKLTPGYLLPEAELAACTIGLGSASAQLAAPLPMADCREIEMPERDCSCDLWVTRAAVKFTFILKNACSRALTLRQLELDRMAPTEYLLPRVTKYGPKYGIEEFEILEYEVPGTTPNDGYYTFRLFEEEAARTLPEGETLRLDPIYLLEGKYTHPDDPRNYVLRLRFAETICEGFFDGLPILPRNTHAVVTVSIRDYDIAWEVCLMPYGKVPLDPIFGLD